MNRRQFFTRAATAAVGLCVAAKIPTAWLPAPVRSTAALEFLRNAFNNVTKGRHGWWPRDMYASSAVFDAAEDELAALSTERFGHSVLFVDSSDPRALMFKGARLHRREEKGWYVTIPIREGVNFIASGT